MLLIFLVVIDAFRLINPQSSMIGQEPRQTTSNIGHLQKPSIQVLGNINS
jgi:26S proteasome regulatory subunit N11